MLVIRLALTFFSLHWYLMCMALHKNKFTNISKEYVFISYGIHIYTQNIEIKRALYQ